MKALTYQGAKDVRVETVADPVLINNDDIILKVTLTAICESDLHIYRGKIPAMKDGDILGHAFMGVVAETGAAVTHLKKSDRVEIPFVIACSDCFYCNKTLFAACSNTNTGRGAIMNKKSATAGAGLFGYSHLYGGYAGGQAKYVRVPKANVGPLKIPDVLADEQVLFPSDILPTGYQAAVTAQLGTGSSVAIFGEGPVGLMAALCAKFLGVEQIFMVDHNSYRLKLAQEAYGVIPINFDDDDDPADTISRDTAFQGADATIDAVGFEAKDSAVETVMTTSKLEGSSGKALRQSIAATRRSGVVSVPGVYAGFIHGFLFGHALEKGLIFKMGQTHAQRHMSKLLKHIGNGKMKPELIVTHRMQLDDAVLGHEIFDQRKQDCRKVILTQ